MTRFTRHGRLILWTAAPLAALAGLGFAADRAPTLALVNESASLPRGVYVRTGGRSAARGAVVSVPQPVQARAYLAHLGMPAETRLLKRVAATAGDRVCRIGDSVRTPGRTVVARTRDRLGVDLPAWRGCRTLGADDLFLLGDAPTSFDSRYFGPVRRSQVEGVYREVITW